MEATFKQGQDSYTVVEPVMMTTILVDEYIFPVSQPVHSVFITSDSGLMLFRKITDIYPEHKTKYIYFL